MEQKNRVLKVDTLLRDIRNRIVKIIPENSSLFRQMSLVGLRLNARKHHVPLTSMVMGVYAVQHCNLNCKCCTAFSPIAEEHFLNVESYKKGHGKTGGINREPAFQFLCNRRRTPVASKPCGSRIIYPCNTIAGIEHFNTYFIYTPKPFCKYCNRQGVEFGIPYGNSKRDIREWT